MKRSANSERPLVVTDGWLSSRPDSTCSRTVELGVCCIDVVEISVQSVDKEYLQTSEVVGGEKLGIQKLSDTEVHLQRTYQGHVPPRHVGGPPPVPGGRGGGSDEGLTDRVGEWIEEKIDEATTKRYSLTKQQLQTVATQLDSVPELRTFLDDHDIEAVSGLQDAFGSAFSVASKFGKAGSFVAGPAAGVASIPVGYYLSKKYGADAADRIQTFIREQLGLSTDQVFEDDATRVQNEFTENTKEMY